MQIALSIIRRRRRGTSYWVVDWFDPKTGCRYEAIFPTLVDANWCRSQILAELNR